MSVFRRGVSVLRRWVSVFRRGVSNIDFWITIYSHRVSVINRRIVIKERGKYIFTFGFKYFCYICISNL